MEILKYVEYQKKIKSLLVKQRDLYGKVQFLKQALLVTIVINVCLVLAIVMYTHVTNQQLIALQQANNSHSTINR